MRAVLALLCIATIFSASGVRAAEGAPADRQVQALMRASGLGKQIDQLPDLVQMGITRQHLESRELSTSEYHRILSLARGSFDPRAMKEEVSGYIRSNLSGKDIAAALEWLESPVGRKITRLEEAASTPQGYDEMQSMAPKLFREYGGTSRFGKIARFDRATMSTERSVEMALDVQLAMITALSASTKEGIRRSHEELQEAIDGMRGQVRREMAAATALQFLYTYRTLTEAEIDSYIAFAESDAGRRYHMATYRGLHDAMTKSALKLGTRLGMKLESI